MYFKKIILKFYSFLFFQCVIERDFVASGLVLLFIYIYIYIYIYISNNGKKNSYKNLEHHY